MRILHIASGNFFSTYGGGQVYVKNIVDEMMRQGRDVAVVSMSGNHDEPVEKNYKGALLIEIGKEDELEAAVKIAMPDVVHAHSLKDIACRVGCKLGIPVVVTAHHGGILCPAGTRLNCKDEVCHAKVNQRDCLPCVLRGIPGGLGVWYPMMKSLSEKNYLNLGRILKKLRFIPFITPIGSSALYIDNKIRQWHEITDGCTLMVAPCYEIAEAMAANGLACEKIRVVPHGIPLPESRPEYPAVIDGRVKFYYVGRICYVKGVHTLLEAFARVENPKIELHLIGGVGSKQERRYMEKLKKHYEDDKRIVWHGKIAPEAIFDATCNYHVSSSAAFLEAFGLNIAESLALGKPVLSTCSGGGEMQIRDGENGWLVPTNSPQALADKIAYIASNPQILPAMSRNCHAISIQEHVNSLFEVYCQCVS